MAATDSPTPDYDPYTESEGFNVDAFKRGAGSSPYMWVGLTPTGDVIDKFDLELDKVNGRRPRGFLVTRDEYVRRMKLAGKWTEPTPGMVWDDDAGEEAA